MEQTWRWWGPDDLITLSHVRQVGATGIVTALHDIPAGHAWPSQAVTERKAIPPPGARPGRWPARNSWPRWRRSRR